MQQQGAKSSPDPRFGEKTQVKSIKRKDSDFNLDKKVRKYYENIRKNS